MGLPAPLQGRGVDVLPYSRVDLNIRKPNPHGARALFLFNCRRPVVSRIVKGCCGCPVGSLAKTCAFLDTRLLRRGRVLRGGL